MCIVLEKLGDFPSQQDLLNEIQKLVELFRRFSRPPIKTIQGLWAELFVIEHSSNPSYLVKSWHTTTSDIFDFNDGTDKLEVKSTSRINRVHRFSHNQLTPNESSIVVIASLCVQQSGVGKTVLDLMDAIEPNLENAELRFQLADMISKTLGSDFEKACEYCFDYALACDTYQNIIARIFRLLTIVQYQQKFLIFIMTVICQKSLHLVYHLKFFPIAN